MKNPLLSVLCAILGLSACTDPKPTAERRPTVNEAPVTDPFTYIRNADTLDWRTVEVRTDPQTKEQVAEALAPLFADNITENYPKLPLPRRLHLLDLNGDQQLDVGYHGPAGGEGNWIFLWLNDGGRYRSLFRDGIPGEVKQLEFQHGRLASLTILDFGCCAEYVEVERKYVFDAQFKPRAVLQRGTTSFTRRPQQGLLPNPIGFKTATDSAALRTSPIADDTTTFIYDAVGKGNVLLKLGKGAKGWVWASQQDSLRQTWHYVELLPNQNMKRYLLYETDSLPTRAFGWMRASDIHQQD